MGRTAKYKTAILLTRNVQRLLKEVAIEKEYTITQLADIIILDWIKDYYKVDPSPAFIEYETDAILEKLH